MKGNFRQITLFVIGALAVITLNMTADAQNRAYRVSDREVQTVIQRVETNTDQFKNQMGRALDNRDMNENREDTIRSMVSAFEQATNRLRDNFNARRSSTGDVQEVLTRGAMIDSVMLRNRFPNRAENTWNRIKADLNTLGSYYNMTVTWTPIGGPTTGFPPYRVPDQDIRALIASIENRTDRFKNQMGRALDRSNIDETRREDSINFLVSSFEEATNRLRDNFNARRSTSADVQEVLNRGALVDRFMRNNRMTNVAERNWQEIRADLITLAGHYNVTPNWNFVGTTDPILDTGYTVTDAQMRILLNRIQQRTSDFRIRYNRWNNPFRRIQTGGEDLTPHITELDKSLNALMRNFSSRTGTRDLEDLLRHAAMINNLLSSTRVSGDISNRWRMLRADFDTLASYYRINWDWNNPVFPDGRLVGGGFDTQLTGTYRLNRSMSDNVTTVVDRAIINARFGNQRDRLRRVLERRLMPPETMVLEKRGSQITMASANGQPVSFTADGRTQTETSPNGRTVTTRVTATSRDLLIDYEGDRMNDYHVTFTPLSNGQLRVTRRVFIENDNETVTVSSIYDKVSPTPQWNTATGQPGLIGGNVEGFIIPNNTALVASLNTQLSTRTARDGDRFSMTVDSPSQYNGAIIEGRVIGERSGVFTGRANLSLSFDTIRLRDGRTYQFAGLVTQVRETDGDLVSVNNEGAIRDRNQTTRTATRAGIGAVLGAIIGAIAGGGEGAAIGAGVGAGAGAGTVILQGRDNLELEPGTQFMITATAPANVIGMR